MPKLHLKTRKQGRGEIAYLERPDGRFFGRVRSSSSKQGDAGLLELIKSEIAKRGFYDPDLMVDHSNHVDES